jgi:hypothetical protein
MQSVSQEQIIAELTELDDFSLNDIIDFGVNSEKFSHAPSVTPVPPWVLAEAFLLWQKRHPGTLPPCFSSVPATQYHFGPRMIYEWPQA